jgi:hypothetical protein
MADGQVDGGQGQGGTTGTGAAGAGTGTGAATGTGTSGAGGTGTSGAGGTQTGTGPTSGAQAFTYAEDRSTWLRPDQAIPKHRFDEVNQKAHRAAELEGQLQEAQNRIRALAGVQPTDANSEKAQQIREAFFNLPGMGGLRRMAEMTEEQLDSLFQVPQQMQQSSATEARQWQRHGDTAVGTIASQVAEAIGADQLDADQQSDLRTSFSSWLRGKIQADMQSLELENIADSPTLQKYEAGDEKLLGEFVARYTKNWVEPARRTQTAHTATRLRSVPNSAGRTQVTSIKRPEKFNSLDERLDYAVGLAKERGVQFGR